MRRAVPARGLFGSVHSRLLAAFCLVILVTLTSAGAGVVWLIQDYQRRLALDRLSEVAIAASLLGRQLEQQGVRPAEIGDILASQLAAPQPLPVRVLLVDVNDQVVAEGGAAPESPHVILGSGDRLRLPNPAESTAAPERPLYFRWRAVVWTRLVGSPPRPYTFVTAPLPVVSSSESTPATTATPATPAAGESRADGGERLAIRRTSQSAFRVVLAIPAQTLTGAWLELLPGLGLAALVSLPLSAAAGLALSRSITQPLRRITRAAEEMARGNLSQEIPVRGTDEVAQLATSFNRMSQEIGRSQQALRDFLANASHELRTPLTSVQGFSQALLDGTVRGEAGASEAGRIINEEALRMRQLVEDLLYLSRVESRQVTGARVPVDVAALVRDVADRLEPAAQQRHLEVVRDLPDPATVIGDADELDHLFGNLVSNAIKYTPDGGRATISGRLAGEMVVVTVHNTGSVIPPGDLPHIFERFYRVDKSRARMTEGSGLGLAIAQEVAQRHQGRITVTSSSEAGTAFVVHLPQAPGGVPAGGPTSPQRRVGPAILRGRRRRPATAP